MSVRRGEPGFGVQQQSTAMVPLLGVVQRDLVGVQRASARSTKPMPSLCKQGVTGSSPVGSTIWACQSQFSRSLTRHSCLSTARKYSNDSLRKSPGDLAAHCGPRFHTLFPLLEAGCRRSRGARSSTRTSSVRATFDWSSDHAPAVIDDVGDRCLYPCSRAARHKPGHVARLCELASRGRPPCDHTVKAAELPAQIGRVHPDS